MIWTSSAIGAVLTLRAVEPARFLFWRDFSKLWTMIGVLGTWAALALVAYLGIAVSRAALGPEAWLGTDLAAGLVAQTSALAHALHRTRRHPRPGGASRLVPMG
jgi:hypothetical protein